MIHLITPLYRYNNIKIIYSTIINQISDFKWYLIEGDNHIDEESLDFLDHDDRVIRCKIKTYHQWGHEQISQNDNVRIKYCPDKYTRYNSLSLEIS